jgi:hypothetical protein
MTGLVVNGHTLPSRLQHLAATGEWGTAKRRVDADQLGVAFGDELILLTPDEMAENTQVLIDALVTGTGDAFGLSPLPPAMSGLLNPSAAVVIAATAGQQALALDYTAGQTPHVLATSDHPDGVKWVEVAVNFDELATRLERSTSP